MPKRKPESGETPRENKENILPESIDADYLKLQEAADAERRLLADKALESESKDLAKEVEKIMHEEIEPQFEKGK